MRGRNMTCIPRKASPKVYPSSKTWLNEYQNYILHMKEFEKDVLLVRISRNHSQAAIIDLRKF
jgi:hypothetical protein